MEGRGFRSDKETRNPPATTSGYGIQEKLLEAVPTPYNSLSMKIMQF